MASTLPEQRKRDGPQYREGYKMRHLFAGAPAHEVHIPFFPALSALFVMGVRLVGLHIGLLMEAREPRAGDFTETLPCPVVVLYGVVHGQGIHILLFQERDGVHKLPLGGTDLFQVCDLSFIRRGTGMQLSLSCAVPCRSRSCGYRRSATPRHLPL